MREGKRYLSLFLAAAITVTGVNLGTAFQVNAANNGAATVSEWRLLTPGDVTSSDGKTELTAKIQEIEAENLNQNGYTANTWKALADALANAKTVNNNANSTKAQRVDALNALIEARKNLKVSPDDGQQVNKTALNAKIAEVKAAKASYTPASWATFAPELAKAEAVAAKANATQTEVDNALTALTTAIGKLVKVTPDEGQEVNKTALNAKIEEANQKVEKDYTPASWATFKTALDAAKAAAGKADATQTEVDNALTALTTAITNLVKAADKTALNAKIAEAEAKKQADYTAASWTAFKTALDAAKAVAGKADATQAEVTTALNNLTTAITNLVKVADKTALNAKIAEAATKKQADYTAASWTAFKTALDAAKTVASNANATQAEVTTALNNLTTAMNKLTRPGVTKVDKKKLKSSIDAANKLKKADYTSATWKKFAAALKDAKSVYNNSKATQKQVDDAKKKLDAAKKALKKVKKTVTKVTITNGKSLKIAAGKKVTLKATVTPKDAANKNVKWSISKKDAKYASVNSKGVVTTKKAGAGKTVTVTATAADGSKKKSTIKISIMKNAVTKITLKAKSKTVKAGKKVTVKATVKTNGKKANKTLAWKSSNTKYATVNSKGVVTTKKAGKGKTVTITAAATDGSGKKGTIKIKITK